MMIQLKACLFKVNCKAYAVWLALWFAACSDQAFGELEVMSIITSNPLMLQRAVQEYSPRLGVGVNASETETFSECVEFARVNSKNLPFQKIYAHEKMIQSHDEIAQAMEISADLQAKSLWGSGYIGIADIANTTVGSNKLNWLVWAKFLLAEENISTSHTSLKLTNYALDLLGDADIPLDYFFKACGTHFYTGQVKGGMFMALHQVDGYQQEAIHRFQEKAGVQTGMLEGKQGLTNYLKHAQMHQAYDITTVIVGGDEQTHKGLNAENFNSVSLSAALDRLADSIHNRDQGVTLKWIKSPYEKIFITELQRAKKIRYDAKSYPWDSFKVDLLGELFHRYQKNQENLYEIHIQEQVLKDESYDEMLKQQDFASLSKAGAKLQAQNKEISQLAKACLEGNDAVCDAGENRMNFETLSAPNFGHRINNDVLGQWDLKFAGNYDRYKIENGYKELLRGRYANSASYCKFRGTSEFIFNERTEEIELKVPVGNSEHKRYIVGTQELMANNLALDFHRPLICALDYAKNCRIQMKPLTGKNLSPLKSQNFVLIVKLFDEYGYLEHRIEFFPVCS